MQVAFDVGDRRGALSQRAAELIAQNLRCFAVGVFANDVAVMASSGVDPGWIDGARALADGMEDTLVGRRDGPIPLDPFGKAAIALMQSLRLAAPASVGAKGEHARLLELLLQAQAAQRNAA